MPVSAVFFVLETIPFRFSSFFFGSDFLIRRVTSNEQNNTTLTELRLPHNNIGSDCATLLAGAIKVRVFFITFLCLLLADEIFFADGRRITL